MTLVVTAFAVTHAPEKSKTSTQHQPVGTTAAQPPTPESTASISTSSNIYLSLSNVKSKLQHYIEYYSRIQQLSPQWTTSVAPKKPLKKNDRSPEITKIRHQLTSLYFIKNQDNSEPDLFDEHLESALKHFQKMHSLNPDGRIGAQTCQQLNLSPKKRIALLQQTLEYINAHESTWGDKFILVNLPTYTLACIQHARIEKLLPVVIGSLLRPTPIHTYPIQNVVLNPSWHVPVSIFVKDKLEKIIHDPDYLEKGEYDLFTSDGEQIEPQYVNWDDISLDYFPYKVRQRPGKHNALGSVKFNLESQDAIYMHGTPDLKLFDKNYRALSSGCIRVANPTELAVWVLGQTHITTQYLENKINSGNTMTIPLLHQIKLYTVNLPVWLNESGHLQFGIQYPLSSPDE